MSSSFRNLATQITFKQFLVALCLVLFAFYSYSQITRDALTIEPFIVPKRFQGAGTTGEVIANPLVHAITEIEAKSETRMKKNFPSSSHDEEPIFKQFRR